MPTGKYLKNCIWRQKCHQQFHRQDFERAQLGLIDFFVRIDRQRHRFRQIHRPASNPIKCAQEIVDLVGDLNLLDGVIQERFVMSPVGCVVKGDDLFGSVAPFPLKFLGPQRTKVRSLEIRSQHVMDGIKDGEKIVRTPFGFH